MAVRAYSEKLKIEILAFEVRFMDGYRYLDRCGETIVQIRKHDDAWLPYTPNPQGGVLKNEKKNLGLTMSTLGMAIHHVANTPIAFQGAEAIVEGLGREAEAVYEIATSALNVSETTRVGFRCRFLAEADSLEEADRFVSRGMVSPILERVEQATHSTLRDSAVVYVVEDLESGERRRVEIASSLTQRPGEAPPTGFGQESRQAFVAVDIDTFTRPALGHFERSNIYIQKTYLRSAMIAKEIFEWLRLLPVRKVH